LDEFTKFKGFIIFAVRTVDEVRKTDHDSAFSDLSLRPNLFTRWNCNIMTRQEYQSINLVRDVTESSTL
jgi:hypothetical protein